MNCCAAFFAALSLLGGTSVAAMLPETSIAMITVPLHRIDTSADLATALIEVVASTRRRRA